MAQQMRIGFIQAKNPVDVDWFRPLAFGYLKSFLSQSLGDSVDMQLLDDLADAGRFDIIGISSTSQDFAIACEIAEQIKRVSKDIVIMLGGQHITFLPQTLPEAIDIGVMGEGEETFCELVRCLRDEGIEMLGDRLAAVEGIVFHGEDGPQITPPRASISPLDRLPLPHRSVDDKPYLFSSRGCPYKCAFCSSSAFWAKTRFFSAEYVVREICEVLKQSADLDHISFWDDLFVADRGRLEEIVRLLEQAGLCNRIGFDLAVRANLVDDQLCSLLKRMNVRAVGFGAESGSDRILARLNKAVTVETNQRAIDTLARHGITVGCSFIIACPTECEREVRSTFEFALRNIEAGKMSPHCAVNMLSPMPGTRIWDEAVACGAVDVENMDWSRLAGFASYRNSNFDNVEQWVQYRRDHDCINLAADTLPSRRLYSLILHYENAIRRFKEPIKRRIKAIVSRKASAIGRRLRRPLRIGRSRL